MEEEGVDSTARGVQAAGALGLVGEVQETGALVSAVGVQTTIHTTEGQEEGGEEDSMEGEEEIFLREDDKKQRTIRNDVICSSENKKQIHVTRDQP